MHTSSFHKIYEKLNESMVTLACREGHCPNQDLGWRWQMAAAICVANATGVAWKQRGLHENETNDVA